MSLLGLLNQTITIYAKTSYNAEGREVVGSGVNVLARVQSQAKRRLLPDGSTIVIDAVVYAPPSTSVNTDDRVDFSGNKYKVLMKYAVPDGQGNTNHIKLELIKWRET